MTVDLHLEIENEKGLHARASARFVELVEAHDADVEVRFNGMAVPGDSIMGLLTLGAARGSKIEISVSGTQAKELANALVELVESKFGEGR